MYKADRRVRIFCTRYFFTDSKYRTRNSPTILNSGHDSEVRTMIMQLSRQNLPWRSLLTGCNIYSNRVITGRYTTGRTLLQQYSYVAKGHPLSFQSTHHVFVLDRQPLDIWFIFSRHDFFGRFNNMRLNTCRFDGRDYWHDSNRV